MKTKTNLCKHLTKKGKKCKNNRWKNSQFCYIHSINKKQEIKLRNHPIFHFVSILGIIIAIIAFLLSASKSKQKTTHENQAKQLAYLENIDSLITAKMVNIRHDSDTSLLEKYPTGYNLVTFGKDSIVLADTARFLESYYIDWSTMKLTLQENGYVDLEWPVFIHIPNSIKITNFGQSFDWNEVGDFELIAKGPEDNIYIEIIDVSMAGIIYCFGFRSNKLPYLE